MTRAPWSPATPGAPITASGWSALQVGFRDALAAHRHTGGADGPRLRGEDIDPASTLRVQSLDLSEGATVGGRDLGEWMADAERAAFEALKPEIATKLPVTGGRISGDLGVGGALTAGKDVKVGGRLVVGGKEVVPRVGVVGRWTLLRSATSLKFSLPRQATVLGFWSSDRRPRTGCIASIHPGHVDLGETERFASPGSGTWRLSGITFVPYDMQARHEAARMAAGPWTAILLNPDPDTCDLEIVAQWA